MARRSSKKKQKSNNTLIYGGLAAVVLVIVLVLVFTQPGQPDTAAGLPPEISVQEARAYQEDGTYILDVRTQEEWDQGHVPGATLIPLDQLEGRMAELPQDQDIVVICRSGNRSAVARDLLLGAGFGSVTSVAGGFNQWAAKGYPVVYGP